MYDVDAGVVSVDDINVKSLYQQSLRSNIGVVAQDTVLFHASLRENVCLSFFRNYHWTFLVILTLVFLDSFHQIIYGKEDATEEEVWEAVRASALEPLVKSLPDGLDTLVGERGMKLSGGEKEK